MAAILIYQVKVAVLLALLYLFYKAAFRQWTLHRLSRVYLLGSVLVSILLPLFSITIRHTMPLSEVSQVSDLVPTTTAAVPLLEMIGSKPAASWVWLVSLTYAAGVFYMLFRLVRAIRQVWQLIRSGEQIPLDDGVRLIVVDRDIVSCSWMQYILISREDYYAAQREILAHERAHIALHHTLDLLLFDLVCAGQWFNPFVRLLRKELVAVHEYQADEAVLKQGADAKAYLRLLLEKAVEVRGLQVINSFSNSLLKRRIGMMGSPGTSPRKAGRVLYVTPLLGIALLANAHVSYQVADHPLLIFDYESISLEALMARQEEAGDATFLSPAELARIFGAPVPDGIVSFNTTQPDSRFKLVPGLNIDDPDAFPLLIVNGVDFPYWRRGEFFSDRWVLKWFAFLHAEDAVPLYGEKARNGAFIANVTFKYQ